MTLSAVGSRGTETELLPVTGSKEHEAFSLNFSKDLHSKLCNHAYEINKFNVEKCCERIFPLTVTLLNT